MNKCNAVMHKITGIYPLKIAFATALLSLPWLLSASAKQDEKLQQVITDLRYCVRMNAPHAHEVGINSQSKAVKFFFGKCGPRASDLLEIGSVPVSSFRHAVRVEWITFQTKRDITDLQ